MNMNMIIQWKWIGDIIWNIIKNEIWHECEWYEYEYGNWN